ncbi:ABC transporter permease [Clostridium niameyense]|uniref:ABC transporter permease n=1 Tax=Clostridium niameyense TaxID=1622073 RepID=A0A6M0RBB6_9CLOT|nr:ABC transporter permease [Clostridium niameyense]NEZ46478.1 ABC transporter permease [Clostridium niameyense]
MSIYKISYNNIKKNPKNYLLYFISIVFSSFIFFSFNSIKYNRDVLKSIGSVALGLNLSSIVVLFFSFIFIYNANVFFREKRKKEIGLYNLLGITKKKIGLMFIYEGFILGIFGVLVGVLLGFMFSKIIMMLLVRLMELDVIIHMNFSLIAISETMLVFTLIILILAVENFHVIKKIPLVNLFREEKQVEDMGKTSKIKGILGMVLIAMGYALALSHKTTVGSLGRLTFILIIVIIGTQLFYKAGLSILLKRLKKFQNFYFKGTNMVSIAETSYKIKSNANILSTVTILIAVCVTALGTTTTFYYDLQKNINNRIKFACAIEENSDSIKKQVDNVLKKYDDKILFNDVIEFKVVQGSYVSEFLSINKKYRSEISVEVLSESSYKKLMNYEKRKYTRLNSNKDVYLIEDSTMIDMFNTDLKEPFIFKDRDQKFNIKASYKEMITNEKINESIIVVKDSVYASLNKVDRIKKIRCIDVKDKRNSFELSNDINKIAKSNKADFSSYAYNYKQAYKVFGLLFFIGIILSILFIIATGSLILFKQISNIYDNKARYIALKKIGANNNHIEKILLKQTSIIFLLPVVLGTFHNLFAMEILKRSLRESITIPVVITLIVYYIAYGIFYLITVKYSKNMIIKS